MWEKQKTPLLRGPCLNPLGGGYLSLYSRILLTLVSPIHHFSHGFDVFRVRTATAAEDVHSQAQQLFYIRLNHFGCFIINRHASHPFWNPCVRLGDNWQCFYWEHFLHNGYHVLKTTTAVCSDDIGSSVG